MPTLSMFYWIIIRMQSEKGGKHHKPHIHCIYGDDEIVIALDGLSWIYFFWKSNARIRIIKNKYWLCVQNI